VVTQPNFDHLVDSTTYMFLCGSMCPHLLHKHRCTCLVYILYHLHLTVHT